MQRTNARSSFAEGGAPEVIFVIDSVGCSGFAGLLSLARV